MRGENRGSVPPCGQVPPDRSGSTSGAGFASPHGQASPIAEHNATGETIHISGLSFTYPGAASPVLHGLDWTVPAGAFALVVGGTGSGKSTLLSLLKPEIAPAGVRTGDARVLGEPLGSLAPAASASGIGYVFQNPDNQLVCESVWHEMAFGLENLGVPQGEMRRLVAETSYFFGMENWFRSRTDTLSGGRKQLLALASVLVMQPRLLLLDEPTAQLDPIAERTFLHALFRVNRELGCTVVVATHRPQAMVPYATCAFELKEGRIGPVADISALEERPALFEGDNVARGGGRQDAASACGAADVGASSVSGTVGAGIPSAPAASRPPAAVNPQRSEQASPFQAFANTRRRAQPAVRLARAWFRYGRDADWVLRNLDLTVAPGRIHALVGGNGSGKSTLLSLMAGARTLSKGSLSCAASARALLPQDPRAVFAEETVADELMEWARMAGCGQRSADAMADRMGLADLMALHPYDLSGGQQQLLALAKLTLTRPGLLLLDEPSKGLDLAARRTVARLLRELADAGTDIVLATHDLDFVSQVVDDVSMVFDGEIACTSPREEFFAGNVYYRP